MLEHLGLVLGYQKIFDVGPKPFSWTTPVLVPPPTQRMVVRDTQKYVYLTESVETFPKRTLYSIFRDVDRQTLRAKHLVSLNFPSSKNQNHYIRRFQNDWSLSMVFEDKNKFPIRVELLFWESLPSRGQVAVAGIKIFFTPKGQATSEAIIGHYQITKGIIKKVGMKMDAPLTPIQDQIKPGSASFNINDASRSLFPIPSRSDLNRLNITWPLYEFKDRETASTNHLVLGTDDVAASLSQPTEGNSQPETTDSQALLNFRIANVFSFGAP